MNFYDDDNLATSGKKIPTGWRVDVFTRKSGPPRQVGTQPWSLIPPTVEVESWILSPRDEKEKLPNEWKLRQNEFRVTRSEKGWISSPQRRTIFAKGCRQEAIGGPSMKKSTVDAGGTTATLLWS